MNLHEGRLELMRDEEFFREYVRAYQAEAVNAALDRIVSAINHADVGLVRSEIASIRAEYPNETE